ncbi:hypothetical protein HYH03_010247 [Edaphochlamys debaryana]|uniref:Uncharacterized protein n=1 Tax=Edaphochlamys debaryana TaxID=47281 RepID=A0A835XWG4_9CHLO|nr:hypothetical protein HYH03_010247 [Edaphochlamys debaryana]|eukprot:KAG2491461.1 hypothetical protein HYH03_010247 [Edaphochlamys debaryana]
MGAEQSSFAAHADLLAGSTLSQEQQQNLIQKLKRISTSQDVYMDARVKSNKTFLAATNAEYEQRNFKRALELYRKAIDEDDHPLAACNLALWYLQGGRPGTPKDPPKAVAIFQEQADKGVGMALANISEFAAVGLHGVKKDHRRAQALARAAIDDDRHTIDSIGMAFSTLFRIYSAGMEDGAPRNVKSALRCLEYLALINAGSSRAAGLLEALPTLRMLAKMDPDAVQSETDRRYDRMVHDLEEVAPGDKPSTYGAWRDLLMRYGFELIKPLPAKLVSKKADWPKFLEAAGQWRLIKDFKYATAEGGEEGAEAEDPDGDELLGGGKRNRKAKAAGGSAAAAGASSSATEAGTSTGGSGCAGGGDGEADAEASGAKAGDSGGGLQGPVVGDLGHRCGQHYCSVDCQRQDWKAGHKETCDTFVRMRAPLNAHHATLDPACDGHTASRSAPGGSRAAEPAALGSPSSSGRRRAAAASSMSSAAASGAAAAAAAAGAAALPPHLVPPRAPLPPPLRRVLGPLDLVMAGVAVVIGAGVFVLTGTAAKDFAGPAVTVSFAVAGAVALAAALCYAEFASEVSSTGGAAAYAALTFGPLAGWLIAINILLEYALAAAAVARGFSGYLEALAGLPSGYLLLPRGGEGLQVDLLAVALLALAAGVVLWGTRQSAAINNAVTAVVLAAVVVVLAAGFALGDPSNYSPFAPFGGRGVLRGASVVFFAYIGFDMVAVAAEEARRPERDVPLGILLSLAACTAIYVLMAAAVTGMVPAQSLDATAPFARAFKDAGLRWAPPVVAVGAIASVANTVVTTLFAAARMVMLLGRQGALPAALGSTHPVTHTPLAATALALVVTAVLSALAPLEVLASLVSLGTLVAFLTVSAAVLWRRTAPPAAHSLERWVVTQGAAPDKAFSPPLDAALEEGRGGGGGRGGDHIGARAEAEDGSLDGGGGSGGGSLGGERSPAALPPASPQVHPASTGATGGSGAWVVPESDWGPALAEADGMGLSTSAATLRSWGAAPPAALAPWSPPAGHTCRGMGYCDSAPHSGQGRGPTPQGSVHRCAAPGALEPAGPLPLPSSPETHATQAEPHFTFQDASPRPDLTQATKLEAPALNPAQAAATDPAAAPTPTPTPLPVRLALLCSILATSATVAGTYQGGVPLAGVGAALGAWALATGVAHAVLRVVWMPPRFRCPLWPWLPSGGLLVLCVLLGSLEARAWQVWAGVMAAALAWWWLWARRVGLRGGSGAVA